MKGDERDAEESLSGFVISKYSKLNDNMSLEIFYTLFSYFFVASGLSQISANIV